MRAMAGALDLLDHEPPTGRPLKRELRLAAVEPTEPLAHVGSRSRRDPTPLHLARLPVERLVGDLLPVHIQRHYDPHRGLLELRRSKRHRVSTTLEPRRSHYISSLWSPVVATGGNRSQIPGRRKAQNEAKTLAVGCGQSPLQAHGKECHEEGPPAERCSARPRKTKGGPLQCCTPDWI
jgi:hypothetical protein